MHRHTTAAGICKQNIDTVIHQRFNQNIGAGHYTGGGISFRVAHLLLKILNQSEGNYQNTGKTARLRRQTLAHPLQLTHQKDAFEALDLDIKSKLTFTRKAETPNLAANVSSGRILGNGQNG